VGFEYEVDLVPDAAQGGGKILLGAGGVRSIFERRAHLPRKKEQASSVLLHTAMTVSTSRSRNLLSFELRPLRSTPISASAAMAYGWT